MCVSMCVCVYIYVVSPLNFLQSCLSAVLFLARNLPDTEVIVRITFSGVVEKERWRSKWKERKKRLIRTWIFFQEYGNEEKENVREHHS